MALEYFNEHFVKLLIYRFKEKGGKWLKQQTKLLIFIKKFGVDGCEPCFDLVLRQDHVNHAFKHLSSGHLFVILCILPALFATFLATLLACFLLHGWLFP